MTSGRAAIEAKQEQKKQSVEQVKAYSELIRNSYKPKVSKRKVREMDALKLKTTANKPKR